MTTQNLEYKEIAETSPIVATALKARDDEQLEIDLLYQEIEERKVKLGLLDNNLAIMATMAQECNDKIEAVKAEHQGDLDDKEQGRDAANGEVHHVMERVSNLLIDGDLGANELAQAFKEMRIILDPGSSEDLELDPADSIDPDSLSHVAA